MWAMILELTEDGATPFALVPNDSTHDGVELVSGGQQKGCLDIESAQIAGN